jgi:hypothetical protein
MSSPLRETFIGGQRLTRSMPLSKMHRFHSPFADEEATRRTRQSCRRFLALPGKAQGRPEGCRSPPIIGYWSLCPDADAG